MIGNGAFSCPTYHSFLERLIQSLFSNAQLQQKATASLKGNVYLKRMIWLGLV
jgi:hypothetical protein